MSENLYIPGRMPYAANPELPAYLKNEIDKISRAFQFSGDWQEITPQWTGATTDPTIGNGTLEGWYRRQQDMVTLSVRMVAGSTTTFGSGAWTFAPPANLALNAVGRWHGACRLVDDGTQFYAAVASINSGQSGVTIYAHGASNTVRDTIPFTWAADDSVHLTIAYKV